MIKDCKISASLMCSDPYKLQNDLIILEQENIDFLHLDIMDGHFVPNYGFSIDFINSVRSHTKIPLDLHLMVENPIKIINKLNLQNKDIISIHFESTYFLKETIDLIRNYNCKLFIAINPITPITILDWMHPYIDGINFLTINPGFSGQKILPFSFEKFKRLNEYIIKNNITNLELEVDGNINYNNALKFKKMGANIFVAGTSAIFPQNKLDIVEIKKYKNLLSLNPSGYI